MPVRFRKKVQEVLRSELSTRVSADDLGGNSPDAGALPRIVPRARNQKEADTIDLLLRASAPTLVQIYHV
jgi:hypothetical protein